ncbi:MAG: hypothetical protein KatS3mg010_0455 [Acidimicrobiia bacterium]|nr:MAG: hypothetical protein KatS3mg010_0455 [Acidimicrobiia bacterium]
MGRDELASGAVVLRYRPSPRLRLNHRGLAIVVRGSARTVRYGRTTTLPTL